MNISSVEEEKRLLRKKMKTLRSERGGNDGKIAENFFSLPEIEGKTNFFIYNAFGSEAGTVSVINRILAEGKQVFLPRVEDAGMVAVPYKKNISMTESFYGIAEPVGRAFEGDLEITVLPLLAADRKGNRLGYGGGYYDKFLKDRITLKIGYCYDFQVIDAVCAAPHDVRLDIIVTDKRIIRIKEERN